MHLVADRKGKVIKENSMQDRLLKILYNNIVGRFFLRPLISTTFSKMGGKILNSHISVILIKPFIRRNAINMADYQQKKYESYNDFFKRELADGARIIEKNPDIFISPCDSRLAVYPIDEQSVFQIKNTWYTAESLLKNKELADEYAGGYIWVFRLCVEDYHRYIYVDAGKVAESFRIPGVFHTVNPIANDNIPIYKENTREYTLIETENFGKILQMEVGAMLVGKIENHQSLSTVQRGQEKGNFAFGGSTVILMTQAGKACPDNDILENSNHGIETKVKLGERVGIRINES